MSKKDQQVVKLIAHGYGRPLTPEERNALGEAAIRSAYFSKYAVEAIRMELTNEQAQSIRQSLNPEQQAIFDQIQADHLTNEKTPYDTFASVAAFALAEEFGGRSNPNIYAVLKAIIES